MVRQTVFIVMLLTAVTTVAVAQEEVVDIRTASVEQLTEELRFRIESKPPDVVRKTLEECGQRNVIVEDRLSIATLDQVIAHGQQHGFELNEAQKGKVFAWLVEYVYETYGGFVNLQTELLTDEDIKTDFFDTSLSQLSLIHNGG